MATTTKTQQRQAAADAIAEVLDIELAAAGERMQSAERSMVRARQRYGQLIEARSQLRDLTNG